MMGPNAKPTILVPKRWKKKIREIMAITMPTVKLFPGTIIFSKPLTPPNPSIADETEMGGVIIPSANNMAAPMMAWCLDTYYKDLFHQENWAEQSFIVPKGIESTLTPLMERIEADFPGVKVLSLPSVGDA